MKFGPDVSVNDVFAAMSEGERCHMANKLYKEGYEPIKMRQKLDKSLADEAPRVPFTVSGVELTRDEMIHVWRRLNPSDYRFEEMLGDETFSRYPEQPKSVNGYSVWDKFDEALRNG